MAAIEKSGARARARTHTARCDLTISLEDRSIDRSIDRSMESLSRERVN
jgi:hypothetical protein